MYKRSLEVTLDRFQGVLKAPNIRRRVNRQKTEDKKLQLKKEEKICRVISDKKFRENFCHNRKA